MEGLWEAALFLTTCTFFREPTIVGQQPDVITSSAAINYVRFRGKIQTLRPKVLLGFSGRLSECQWLAVNPLTPPSLLVTPARLQRAES